MPTSPTKAKRRTPTHSGPRDEDQHELAGELRALVGQISRQLRPTRAGAGLTPSQIAILFTVVRVCERQTGVGVSAVAEREGMNVSMVSRIAASLCEVGLLAREASPEDRRRVTLYPTAAGRRMRERIHRERTEALARHVRGLQESERAALREALPVLAQIVERIDGARR
jgi:DNA-binding MarR family transcriptional regulator